MRSGYRQAVRPPSRTSRSTQDALINAVRGRDLAIGTFPVLADLVAADANPHLKKDSGRVVEVRVEGSTVGFLTKAMSDRFLPALDAAGAQGKRVTCEASLYSGTKAGEDVIEIRLHAAQPGTRQ